VAGALGAREHLLLWVLIAGSTAPITVAALRFTGATASVPVVVPVVFFADGLVFVNGGRRYRHLHSFGSALRPSPPASSSLFRSLAISLTVVATATIIAIPSVEPGLAAIAATTLVLVIQSLVISLWIVVDTATVISIRAVKSTAHGHRHRRRHPIAYARACSDCLRSGRYRFCAGDPASDHGGLPLRVYSPPGLFVP
jgi:hypothetical protein